MDDNKNRNQEYKTMCGFCEDHSKGDTLYERRSYDGGIDFEYIQNIKFCPICGRELDDQNLNNMKREGEIMNKTNSLKFLRECQNRIENMSETEIEEIRKDWEIICSKQYADYGFDIVLPFRKI